MSGAARHILSPISLYEETLQGRAGQWDGQLLGLSHV